MGVIVGFLVTSIVGITGWNFLDHLAMSKNITIVQTENLNFTKTIERIDRNMETLNQNFINSQLKRPLIPLEIATTTTKK
jgi:hypothetical protein